MRIELTPEQQIEAAEVAVRRQKNALAHGLESRHLNTKCLLISNIHAAGAELAASLALKLPWTGRDWLWAPGDTVPPPDLGNNTEVKLSSNDFLTIDTRNREEGHFYVMVTGELPAFEVVGYIPDAWIDPAWVYEYPERTVYRVPRSELKGV